MNPATVTIHEALARAACAAWHSEDANVAEKACRVIGNDARAIVWRTRSSIAWDRALRTFDELRARSLAETTNQPNPNHEAKA